VSGTRVAIRTGEVERPGRGLGRFFDYALLPGGGGGGGRNSSRAAVENRLKNRLVAALSTAIILWNYSASSWMMFAYNLNGTAARVHGGLSPKFKSRDVARNRARPPPSALLLCAYTPSTCPPSMARASAYLVSVWSKKFRDTSKSRRDDNIGSVNYRRNVQINRIRPNALETVIKSLVKQIVCRFRGPYEKTSYDGLFSNFPHYARETLLVLAQTRSVYQAQIWCPRFQAEFIVKEEDEYT